MKLIHCFGAGLVGSYVATKLAESGHQVHIYDINQNNSKFGDEKNITFHIGDVFDQDLNALGNDDMFVNMLPGDIGHRLTEKLASKGGRQIVDLSFSEKTPDMGLEEGIGIGTKVLWDVGIAPGLSNMFLAAAHKMTGGLKMAEIKVGGNPAEKKGEKDMVTPSPPKTAAQSQPALSLELSGQKDAEPPTSNPAQQEPLAGQTRTRVDWPVFRGNPASTGYTPESASDTLEVLWEFKVENGAFESTPVIVDGVVFIGDLDNRVFALDLESGDLLWEFTTEIGFYAAPAVQDGRVFIGNMDGFFYCLNANDGKLIWTFEAAATIDGGANFYIDNVIFGSQDAKLYCLDQKTGKLVWEHEIDDQIRCSPSIVENRAFVAGCDGVLHMINLDDGTSIGGVVIDSPTGVTPATMGHYTYLGTEQIGFFCIDWKAAKVKWNYQDPLGPASTRSNPAVTAGHVVFGSRNRKVVSLDPENGEVSWQFEARGPIDSSPVIADQRVYVGADDRRMYVLDLKTGEKIAERELNGKILGSPAISDGRLIVATNRGVVYCLGSKK